MILSGLAGIYSTSLSLPLLLHSPFLFFISNYLTASLFLTLLRPPLHPPLYQITPVCFFFHPIFLLSFASSLPYSPPSFSVQECAPSHLLPPPSCTFSPAQSNNTNPQHHHPFSCFFNQSESFEHTVNYALITCFSR